MVDHDAQNMKRAPSALAVIFITASVLQVSSLAAPSQVSAAPASSASWSASHPRVVEDLTAGKPLVVHVVVPLCSNAQISCGSPSLGNPQSLRGNLYWGALFGNKRFFDKDKRYTLVSSTKKKAAGLLERAVYRRWVDAKAWPSANRKATSAKKIEQLVVLDAVHGSYINTAVETFWAGATGGGKIEIV